MKRFKRVKKQPVVSVEDKAKADAALRRANQKLKRAERLAAEVKPVMHDLEEQRKANHFALDIYRAMLDGGQ